MLYALISNFSLISGKMDCDIAYRKAGANVDKVDRLHSAGGAFSRAQEAWSIIATADGFIGQIGGWDHQQPEQACILGLWCDLSSYQTFMDQIHDSVTDANAQGGTYSAIHVGLFDKVLDIKGEAATLSDVLIEGAVLRVADCTVKQSRQSHFVQMQRDIWNVGMAKASGMWGWWSSAFAARFILYNPDDLAQVATGELASNQPSPYAHLDVDEVLFMNPDNVETEMLGTGAQRIGRMGDVAYDRTNQRVYVLELFADGAQPVVHVWQIQ